MHTTDSIENPVSGGGGLTTPRAAAVVVIGALALLIVIRRSGLHAHVAGISVSVK